MFCNLIVADVVSLKRVDIENFLRRYQTKYANLMRYTLLVFDGRAGVGGQQEDSGNPIWREFKSLKLDSFVDGDEGLLAELDQKLPAKVHFFNCYVVGGRDQADSRCRLWRSTSSTSARCTRSSTCPSSCRKKRRRRASWT